MDDPGGRKADHSGPLGVSGGDEHSGHKPSHTPIRENPGNRGKNLDGWRAGNVLLLVEEPVVCTPATAISQEAYQRIQALRQWEQRQVGTPPADLSTVLPLDRESELEADLWLAPIALTGGGASPATVEANPFPARRASDRGFLPLTLTDYLQLLDWTGRQLRSGKPGAIPAASPPILERLRIDASRWPTLVSEFSRLFRSAAGRLESLVREAQRTGRHWLHGVRQAANAFG